MTSTKKIIFFLLFAFFLITAGLFYWDFKTDNVQNHVEFSLDENAIELYSDYGFPSIKFGFSTSSFVKIKVYNPDSDLVDVDYFLKGDDKEAVMNLGYYKQTLSDGDYTVEVYDMLNEKIFTKTLSFDDSDLKITSMKTRVWSNEDNSYIVGLNLELKNDGGLPVYPEKIQLNNGFQSFTGYVLPVVVMPNQNVSVDCTVFEKSVNDSDEFSLSIFDFEENLLVDSSFEDVVSLDVEEKIFKNFSSYTNNSLMLPFPEFLYDYYKGLDRVSNSDYSVYVFDRYDDKFVNLVSELLTNCYPNKSGFDAASQVDQINYVASFIQNLDYKEDVTEFDYPNYPIETLFNRDGGCDCEDKSILSASILEDLGFNVVLLELPNHMALGVNLDGEYIPDKDLFISDYYYLETSTTGLNNSSSQMHGFQLGDVPENYTSSYVVDVFEISSRYLLNHVWKENIFSVFNNSPIGNIVKVSIIVENLGVSTVSDVQIRGTIYNNDSPFEGYTAQSETDYYISYIVPGEKKEVNLIIKVDTGDNWFFKTEVLVDGSVKDKVESKGAFTI